MRFYGPEGWWMMSGLGWVTMLLIWALLILGVVYLWRALGGGEAPRERGGPVPPVGADGHDRALQIVRERYAKGEINREEYERLRRDLGAPGTAEPPPEPPLGGA